MIHTVKNILTTSTFIAGALVSLSSITQADPILWNGSLGDGISYSDKDNWSPASVPANGDDATINTSTVNYDITASAGTLQADSLDINDSTFNVTAPVIRLNGGIVDVDSTSTLTGNIWDMNNGTINFAAGSVASMNEWENKGTNVFTFELGSAGFNTFNVSTFSNDGNNTGESLTDKMAKATYDVDMTAYSGGTGVIKLIDYVTDATRDDWNGSSWNVASDAMTDAIFQNANLIVDANAGVVANLQWNAADNSIDLNISAVPEPSSYALLAGSLALGAIMLRRRR